ncbi:MAG: hypothetical protein AAB515_04135 [Patescibacteria group bacterium]
MLILFCATVVSLLPKAGATQDFGQLNDSTFVEKMERAEELASEKVMSLLVTIGSKHCAISNIIAEEMHAPAFNAFLDSFFVVVQVGIFDTMGHCTVSDSILQEYGLSRALISNTGIPVLVTYSTAKCMESLHNTDYICRVVNDTLVVHTDQIKKVLRPYCW